MFIFIQTTWKNVKLPPLLWRQTFELHVARCSFQLTAPLKKKSVEATSITGAKSTEIHPVVLSLSSCIECAAHRWSNDCLYLRSIKPCVSASTHRTLLPSPSAAESECLLKFCALGTSLLTLVQALLSQLVKKPVRHKMKHMFLLLLILSLPLALRGETFLNQT